MMVDFFEGLMSIVIALAWLVVILWFAREAGYEWPVWIPALLGIGLGGIIQALMGRRHS